jgi:Galactose oxidase, central domain
MQATYKLIAIRSIFSVFCVSMLAGCAGLTPPASQSTATSSGSAGVEVAVSPNGIGLARGGTFNFQSIVLGSNDRAVTWSVREPAGGTISTSGAYGVYNAPTALGVYHVVATSQADPTQSAVATVNVIAADFTSAGDLGTARLQHTATLLANGKVLVAGGGYGPDVIDGYTVADQSELFDPATDVFNPAGKISRDAHTATLLQNGDVLFAGGEIGWSNGFPIVSNTADLRIAATGLIQPTGSMALGREAHVATLLNDGRVLITGGLIPSGISWKAVPDSEIYDPDSGTFSPTGKMNVARALHTATLLPNGKVLVAGGGYIYGSATAELFDPSTGTFTQTGSMSVLRQSGTATLLPSGKVLVTGESTIADLYDPSTGTFVRTGDMSEARTNATATLLQDGTVLIVGGSSSGSTEIYTPAAGTFLPGIPLHQGRFSHTATLLPDGRVVITGGAAFTDGLSIDVLASTEIYQ